MQWLRLAHLVGIFLCARISLRCYWQQFARILAAERLRMCLLGDLRPALELFAVSTVAVQRLLQTQKGVGTMSKTTSPRPCFAHCPVLLFSQRGYSRCILFLQTSSKALSRARPRCTPDSPLQITATIVPSSYTARERMTRPSS